MIKRNRGPVVLDLFSNLHMGKIQWLLGSPPAGPLTSCMIIIIIIMAMFISCTIHAVIVDMNIIMIYIIVIMIIHNTIAGRGPPQSLWGQRFFARGSHVYSAAFEMAIPA